MLACPVCPAIDRDPAGWFRYRLRVATEIDCIEWWYRENLMFVAGLAVVVLSAVAVGLVVWARYRWPPDPMANDYDDSILSEADPMANQRKMPPAVAALLEEHMKASKSVWHWSQFKPDEVSVQLITTEIADTVEKVMGNRGLGGCGRSLLFRKVSGRWSFIGSGRWIS